MRVIFCIFFYDQYTEIITFFVYMYTIFFFLAIVNYLIVNRLCLSPIPDKVTWDQ